MEARVDLETVDTITVAHGDDDAITVDIVFKDGEVWQCVAFNFALSPDKRKAPA